MIDVEGFINDKDKYYLTEGKGKGKTEYMGTKLEIAEQYIKANGLKIEYRPMSDGDGYNIVLLDPQIKDADMSVIADDWTAVNDGSDKEAIYSLYAQLLNTFYDAPYVFCDLADSEVFKMDYDELLKKITAQEVWENGLDLDDDAEIREWYCYLREIPDAEEEVFKMDYEELLKKITAQEVLENCLDLDNDREVREWYCYEREAPNAEEEAEKDTESEAEKTTEAEKAKSTATNFEKVKEFMRVFEQHDRADLLVDDTTQDKAIDLRFDLIDEEYNETMTALTVWRNHIEFQGSSERRDGEILISATEIIDGLTDMLYVIYGAFVLFGIDADEAFSRVHRSNMSKLGRDGKPVFRKDGKVMKGPDFRLPQLSDLIRNRHSEAAKQIGQRKAGDTN